MRKQPAGTTGFPQVIKLPKFELLMLNLVKNKGENAQNMAIAWVIPGSRVIDARVNEVLLYIRPYFKDRSLCFS